MRRVQLGVTEDARQMVVKAAAAAGAALIVISLFLPWFAVGLSESVKGLAEAGAQGQLEAAEELGGADAEAAVDLIDESIEYSGWSSLELADALLLFVALAAGIFALRRWRGEASARPREDDDRLMLLGLLAVVVVLVLLLTKNSFLGMLDGTIGFAQDKAAEFDVPGAQFDVLSIAPGIGLWLGLAGALLTFAAGVFHSLVDPTGAARTTATPAATGSAPAPGTQPPPPAGPAEAPTEPLPKGPGPGG